MPFNGQGVFTRLYSWAQDAANGILIRSDRMDSEMNGFATGLSNCITRDGQGKPTANIDWSNNKILNLADAANPQDALNQRAGDARYYQKGGAIDGSVIGQTTPVSGGFTTVTAGTSITVNGATADTGAKAQINGRLDTGDMLRAGTWHSNPTSGAGVELFYSSGYGYVQVYDRTSGTVIKPLLLNPASGGRVIAGGTTDNLVDTWQVNGTLATGSSSYGFKTRAGALNVTPGWLVYATRNLAAWAGTTASGLSYDSAGNFQILADTATNLQSASYGTTGTTVFQITGNGRAVFNGATDDTNYSAVFGGAIKAPNTGKAWVNFNGTNGSIRASQNVSSVVRNGAGDYTVNFMSALADANYAPVITGSGTTSVASSAFGLHTQTGGSSVAPTTTSFRFVAINNSAYADLTYITVHVDGN